MFFAGQRQSCWKRRTDDWHGGRRTQSVTGNGTSDFSEVITASRHREFQCSIPVIRFSLISCSRPFSHEPPPDSRARDDFATLTRGKIDAIKLAVRESEHCTLPVFVHVNCNRTERKFHIFRIKFGTAKYFVCF
jgi:hypothetical protein